MPRQASKPMQLINSFVSAVANGAMLMMSSSSNQSKSSPVTFANRPVSQPNPQQQPNSAANSKIEQSIVATPPRKLLASKASADDEEEAEVEEEGSKDAAADEAESRQKQNASLVNLKMKPVEVVVNPVIITEQKSQQTFDVNKKTNRKSYSEVILTESAASSINSDFRPRPNSMSLNNFNPIRTPTTTASANRPTNNFYAYRQNNNNNNQNKNSYHKNNRHSVCLSAPTSARTSTTFNIDSKNSSFTKSTTPTARTFNSQKPANTSNNNARNGSKFNSKPQTPNVNITKKK